jgi:hypothetical protein
VANLRFLAGPNGTRNVYVPPENNRAIPALGSTEYLNEFYYYNGSVYSNEAAFNTAIGITKSGITRVMTFGSPFNQTELSGSITGTTAASGSGTQTILQLDDGSESNRIRIEYDWSLSTVYSYITIGGSNTKSALGTIAANTEFTVRFTASTSRLGFAAWLTTGYSKFSAIASLPTFTNLRIGRSFTGNTWTGSISKWAIWADRDTFGNALFGEGDSYEGGGTGVSQQMRSVIGRTYLAGGGGLGGSTLLGETVNVDGYHAATTWNSSTAYAVNDTVVRNGISYVCISPHTNQQPPNITYWGDPGILWRMHVPNAYEQVIQFWDGNAAGNEFASTDSSSASAIAYCDRLYNGYNGIGGLKNFRDFIINPPMVIRITGVSMNFNIAVRAEMLSRWPTKCVDWMPVLSNDGTYVDDIWKNPPGGDTEGHVSPEARALIAAANDANLIGRGL